jgi:sulfur carrier protein ThiS
MEIQINLYGSLQRFSQPETPGMWQGDIPTDSKLRDLIARIGIPEKEIWIAAINGAACPFDAEIPEGAKVTIVTARGSGG